jgi:hypothetical protein
VLLRENGSTLHFNRVLVFLDLPQEGQHEVKLVPAVLPVVLPAESYDLQQCKETTTCPLSDSSTLTKSKKPLTVVSFAYHVETCNLVSLLWSSYMLMTITDERQR